MQVYKLGAAAQSQYTEFDVAADGSTVVPDILVRPLPKIRGIVLDPQGKPLPKAIVRLRDSSLTWDDPVLTDANGRFEFSLDRMPEDLLTDKPQSVQTILAFHPYQPLGAQTQVRLSDTRSLDNIVLRIARQDYDYPVTAFPNEFASLMRAFASKKRGVWRDCAAESQPRNSTALSG